MEISITLECSWFDSFFIIIHPNVNCTIGVL